MKPRLLTLTVLVLCLSSKGFAAPNTGSGPSGTSKYAQCKVTYDQCIGRIVFRPGTQSYNVAKSRCYQAWRNCVGLSAAISTGSVSGDIQLIEEYQRNHSRVLP